MDLKALQRTLREFAAERGWDEVNTPKNLTTALMVEAAELAEIFQWMSPEVSRCTQDDPTLHERVCDEVADVLIYLLQVADRTGVDLKRAVGRKLQKNASKYPVESRPPAVKPSVDEARTHVFVDFENCQPDERQIRDLVPEASDIWLFHAPNQKERLAGYGSWGERFTAVPVMRRGSNSLDFHLTFYAGFLVAGNPKARFVVISNDKGFAPMVGHAQDLKYNVRLQPFPPSESGVAKAVPTKAKAGKVPAKIAAPPGAEALGKKALAALRKMKVKAALPGSGGALRAHLKAMVEKSPGVKMAAVLAWLQQKGHCRLKPDGSVEYKL